MTPIRVIVIERERLIRDAIGTVLRSVDDIDVVDHCGIGDTISTRSARSPLIALIGLAGDCDQEIAEIGRLRTPPLSARVLAMTGQGSRPLATDAVRAGAMGCISRNSEASDLIAAVRSLHAGRHVFCPQVWEELAECLHQPLQARTVHALQFGETLSVRELAVVTLLSRGMSNAEIAESLFLSEATIKTHLSRIMTKWGVRDRVQVLLRAARAGLVVLD